MEENKDKKPSYSGKLQLKKTFNAGQIKQSFSHGRSRSVSVEVKRKRTLSGFKSEEKNLNEVPASDEPEKSLTAKPQQKSDIQKEEKVKDESSSARVEKDNLKKDNDERKIPKKIFRNKMKPNLT